MTATDTTTTSKGFFISVSANALRMANMYSKVTDKCLERAEVSAALAELPEDMALRARLAPDLFRAEA